MNEKSNFKTFPECKETKDCNLYHKQQQENISISYTNFYNKKKKSTLTAAFSQVTYKCYCKEFFWEKCNFVTSLLIKDFVSAHKVFPSSVFFQTEIDYLGLPWPTNISF